MYWENQPEHLDEVRSRINDGLRRIPINDRLHALTFGGHLEFSGETIEKMATDPDFMELILEEITKGDVASIAKFLTYMHYIVIIKNFKTIPEEKRQEEYRAVVLLNDAYTKHNPQAKLIESPVMGGLQRRLQDLFDRFLFHKVKAYVEFIKTDAAFYEQVVDFNRQIIEALEAVKPSGDLFLRSLRDLLKVEVANRT